MFRAMCMLAEEVVFESMQLCLSVLTAPPVSTPAQWCVLERAVLTGPPAPSLQAMTEDMLAQLAAQLARAKDRKAGGALRGRNGLSSSYGGRQGLPVAVPGAWQAPVAATAS